MVEMVHHSEVRQRLQAMTREGAAVFVRQSCVMPENLERLFVPWRHEGDTTTGAMSIDVDSSI
jgi:hypothetical protein